MQPHLATLDSRTDTPLTQESQDPEASFEVRRRMDLRDCEALMRTGSKSFFAASLVLPGRVRGPATALYAFCRLADDTIDLESHLYGGPMGALQHLQQRLQRIYDGRPSPVPADRALAAVVAKFSCPRPCSTRCSRASNGDLNRVATTRSSNCTTTVPAWRVLSAP